MDGGKLLKHYRIGSIQPDDAIAEWGLSFRLGNIIKYTARCNHKGTKTDDLLKVIWYAVKELTDSPTEADAAISRVQDFLDMYVNEQTGVTKP
jgi:hypothetical protein